MFVGDSNGGTVRLHSDKQLYLFNRATVLIQSGHHISTIYLELIMSKDSLIAF